ncbi:MAG: Gfa-like protein [Parcubacteria bacterium C7867-001]|nr:MAG: Gfa-like protein [Parcubacteria bacterium C7867-001]
MEKHTGGCHCTKVRYEVELDLTRPVLDCNCSHCAIKGLLLAFVPESQFTLLSGADDLETYKFSKGHISHMACKSCGVQPFGKGMGKDGPMVAINVRTLDDVDLKSLTYNEFNGKDL